MTRVILDNDAPEQRQAMAERLREAREYLGLSQDQVAEALGVSRPAVTNIESGQRKVEAIELKTLAKLYGQSVEFLLSGETSKLSQEQGTAYLARAIKGLSPGDLDEVARFAEFLRMSNNDPRRGNKP